MGMGTGEGDGGSWAYVGGKRDIHTYSLDGWMDGRKSVDRAGTTKPLSDFLAARDTRKTDTAVKKPLLVGTERVSSTEVNRVTSRGVAQGKVGGRGTRLRNETTLRQGSWMLWILGSESSMLGLWC